MDRRQRKSESHFNKFLKPGALARLRDSKIIARSVRSAPLMRLVSPMDNAVSVSDTDGCNLRFVYRVSGPRYLLRKKLVASKSVYFMPPSPDLPDPFVDVGFGSDLVASH